MLTVILLTVVVPVLLAFTFLGLQRVQSTPFFQSLAHARGRDARGIALQTIIIMVVLLAIAGAVAAVLLTRAGTETDRLQDETDRWSDITSFTGCEMANGNPLQSDGTTAATSQANFASCGAP